VAPAPIDLEERIAASEPAPVVQPAPAPVRANTPVIRTSRPAPVEMFDEPEAPAEEELEPLRTSAPAAAPESAGRSFASLFGWKGKPAAAGEPQPAPRAQPAADAGFDDELEIPAFLRRSANT
jgi:hypothetical protein